MTLKNLTIALVLPIFMVLAGCAEQPVVNAEPVATSAEAKIVANNSVNPAPEHWKHHEHEAAGHDCKKHCAEHKNDHDAACAKHCAHHDEGANAAEFKHCKHAGHHHHKHGHHHHHKHHHHEHKG